MAEKARSGKKERKPYRDYELQVSQQIQAQSFAPVYLICGEQTYLRTYNIRRLQKAILGDGDAMNAAVLSGPDVRASQVMELAETLPFFAERRVITLTETEFLKKPGDEPEKLAEYLSRMPETTHLILEEPAPNATYKLYKAIAKVGLVVRCDLAVETVRCRRIWTSCGGGHRDFLPETTCRFPGRCWNYSCSAAEPIC